MTLEDSYTYTQALNIIEDFMVKNNIRQFCSEYCIGHCCASCRDMACLVSKKERRITCSSFLCGELCAIIFTQEQWEAIEKIRMMVCRCVRQRIPNNQNEFFDSHAKYRRSIRIPKEHLDDLMHILIKHKPFSKVASLISLSEKVKSSQRRVRSGFDKFVRIHGETIAKHS